METKVKIDPLTRDIGGLFCLLILGDRCSNVIKMDRGKRLENGWILFGD